MSMSLKLSIVVSVYNGERFLPQFFANLSRQKLTDFELILVDDGSTDNSHQMLAKYVIKFPKAEIITQKNQGVSIARNTGLAKARGDYVAFPDIDDVICPGMYNRLLGIAQTNDLDIATCNGHYVYDDGRPARKIFPSDRLSSTAVLSGPEWLQQALNSRKFLHVTWLNIYKRAFLAKHNYQFEPGLHHQDIPWTTELLLTANRVQYIDESFYDYLIHSSSVSHTPADDRIKVRTAHHYMKILEMLNNINQRYPQQVKLAPACHWQIAKEGLGILHTINEIESSVIKQQIVHELFERGIWSMIWKNARGFRLHWRLARRYPRLRAALKAV
ncbi:glycosyltransferase [Photorhabdus heterorhabditis]|uniref:Glycosyl transferase n=1 Tax=Photorhabdus heterorhabditis TaxID=880156 RepID=A0A5B0WSI0_9GAMM|nr:glycosyltransferase [Photorhabdus heterorhabditis]KAA1189876.1 glycosyltransferase [Photorhabdus heterorhabditis]KOY62025.1 glycosyl transferase [Photorhabdus heterorhabditis]